MASSHIRRRPISRWLLLLLALVLGVGAVVYVHNERVKAAEQKPTAAATGKGAKPSAVDPASAAMAAHDPTAPRTAKLIPAMATGPEARSATTAPSPPPAPPAAAFTPSAPAPQLLATARTKADAGDLLGARDTLNDAYCNAYFTGADAEIARSILAAANTQLVLSPKRFPNDPYVQNVQFAQGQRLPVIAREHALPWEGICRINNVSDRKIRVGLTLKVPQGPFHVVVTKSLFRVDLFLGGLPGEAGALYVASVPCGLGENGSTPTGMWSVLAGSKGKNFAWTNPRTNQQFAGDDPKNPLGGYWIGLKGEEGNAMGKASYGIHGTIDPDSIGKQMSMGCVRLRHDDIALLYDLLSEGKTRVQIRD